MTTPRTDAELQDAVAKELEWAPNVNSTGIGVSVDGGAVTLSGEVDSYPERRRAEKAALRVRGVTAVAEEITVRNLWGAVSDSDIAREATEALQRDIDVPHDSVKAVVLNHSITLSGPVHWEFQRKAADRAVRNLKGVAGLYNAITIEPAVSPSGVQQAISKAFVRTAQFDGKHVTVTADAGVVTLEGTVHSWSERQQANATAWSAPGVTGVTNRLRIMN